MNSHNLLSYVQQQAEIVNNINVSLMLMEFNIDKYNNAQTELDKNFYLKKIEKDKSIYVDNVMRLVGPAIKRAFEDDSIDDVPTLKRYQCE